MSLSQNFRMKEAGRFFRAPHRKEAPKYLAQGPHKPKATTVFHDNVAGSMFSYAPRAVTLYFPILIGIS